MKYRAVLLSACLVALSACRDDPAAILPSRPTFHPTFIGTTNPPAGTDVGLSWRAGDTLLAYDKRPEVGIGVNFFAGSPGYPEVSQLHMRLVRITYCWPYADPTLSPGLSASYVNNLTDLVQRAHAAGMEPVVVVHSNCTGPNYNLEPTGLGSSDPHANGAVYQQFANFMQQTAQQFSQGDKAVRFWQLFNEMDAGYDTDANGAHARWTRLFGAEDPSLKTDKAGQGWHYAQMLKLAYPAIKAGNPNAWVLSGGLTGLGVNDTTRDYAFLHGMYNGGARDAFDFVAVHIYGGLGPAPIDSAGSALVRHLAWNNDPGRPVWVTEFGTSAALWSAEHGGAIPSGGAMLDSAQTAFWDGALTTHQTSGYFVKMIGYQLWTPDGAAPAGTPVSNLQDYTYGLLRADGVTRRPLFNSLASGNFNTFVLGTPSRTVDIDITYDGRVPASLSYDRLSNGILRVHGVTIDNLVPTKIPFVRVSSETGARVCYQGYTPAGGWSGSKCDWQIAGLEWQSRLEAINISLQSPQAGVGICYSVYRSVKGWLPEVCNGATAGDVVSGQQIEALRIRIVNPTSGMRVCYQSHNPVTGWSTGVVCDNEVSGTTGHLRPISAFQARILP